ncbi:glucose-6-phosphate dehydrogenase [Streptomyces sp. NPDC046985]|uniref:glucose-6-phosphate dehydrogenase n=1 Tax=Streptomyces sp. NPDC046985 TaxID=3155377 RepID=UPI0033D96734
MLVLFGATGDLATRLLFPALFELYDRELLPPRFAVIGSSRHSPGADEDFRRRVTEAVLASARGADPEKARRFAERTQFVAASAEDGTDLAAAVARRRSELGDGCRTFLYLALPPRHLAEMLHMAERTGLADHAHLMVEKPLGEDVDSARALNRLLAATAPEERVLRVDHFLAKEPVRDLLTLRTENGWLAALWNRRRIAWVQIDVPETLGIEGRASFMEATGVFRDMVPTHLAQVLAAVAMEPPASDDAEEERAARLRLFRRTRPFQPDETVFGQYDGYRDEEGVADDSATETFAALRVWIDDPRWEGVPFLLRTGKAMGSSDARVTVRFRPPDAGARDTAPTGSDLVVHLGAEDGVRLGLRLDRPGPHREVVDAELRLARGPSASGTPLSSYARVFLHALDGDRRLFTTPAEVERIWELAAPVLDAPPRALPYARGSFGPRAADALAADGGWRTPAS